LFPVPWGVMLLASFSEPSLVVLSLFIVRTFPYYFILLFIMTSVAKTKWLQQCHPLSHDFWWQKWIALLHCCLWCSSVWLEADVEGALKTQRKWLKCITEKWTEVARCEIFSRITRLAFGFDKNRQWGWPNN
jgi:hypothetical protein